jgi:hypothetical protein
VCGEYHANYPPLIYDRLQKIKKSFSWCIMDIYSVSVLPKSYL